MKGDTKDSLNSVSGLRSPVTDMGSIYRLTEIRNAGLEGDLCTAVLTDGVAAEGSTGEIHAIFRTEELLMGTVGLAIANGRPGAERMKKDEDRDRINGWA